MISAIDPAPIWQHIRDWHQRDRRASITRAFELGDLIVNAVIATRLTEYQVIARIMHLLGPLAMGKTSYNRAARLVRVYTRNQRQVLIDNALSLAKAETLAGAQYDQGRKRIKIISDIKAGRIRPPWSEIRSLSNAHNARTERALEPPGMASLLEADVVLSVRDTTDEVEDKLRGYLSRRNDAREIIEDVRSAIASGTA